MTEELNSALNKDKKVRQQINVSMNDEDTEILDELKRMLGLNTTGVIKLLIREGLNNRKDERGQTYHRKPL